MIGRAPSGTPFKLIRCAGFLAAGVLVFSAVANAQLRFDLLHSFSASASDGSNSSAPLAKGPDGSFYGTTYNGGSNAKGTVFKITATGNFSLLHSFVGSDGDTPYSGLLLANDGNFYGTTYQGGAYNLGTVYMISPAGSFGVIHSFRGVAVGDGARPYYGSSLIQGSDGNLYGVTYNGGVASSGNVQGRGTVFRMTLAGATTILHSFTGGTNIAFPYGGLVQATDGNLYGTAYAGDLAGNGGIFRIDPMTTAFTVLHVFQRSTEGANPIASLIQGTDGNLYGTTHLGGSSDMGTVFRLPVPGTAVTVVHTFMGSDGSAPDQPLIQAFDGNFYGTTKNGGAGSPANGTVFKMTPSGTLTTLHSFTGPDGANPFAPVIQMPDGALYGTTSSGGGSSGSGVIFRLRSNSASGDFDWDTRADLTLFRGSEGRWYSKRSSTNYTTYFTLDWGLSSDKMVPGDYDGDGRQDAALYRPSQGIWYILTSKSNYTNYVAYAWGLSSDVPVPGDFDGDGKTDLGLWRPSTGIWYVLRSSTNFTTYSADQWGLSSDLPVVGDYDGDGKADLGLYRPSTGIWYVKLSTFNYMDYIAKQWGLSGDIPVVADYDGDGRADMALFRQSQGIWYILQSSTNYTTYMAHQWGFSTDVLVPADYDGDGKADLGLWRPSSGYWYLKLSTTNYTTYIAEQWGLPTDVPVGKRP
jgi:uncharacterized repeat protein (TIGR03803 family)